MFACFDDRGRLLVADSAGSNPSGEALAKDPPHRIRRLEDADGDGRFDKGGVFADKLTYPQGVAWHDGAVYTASPPSLLRLVDTDGDGVADSRRELVTGWVLTGVADELHGPDVGPDGRIYWYCGRFPHQIRVPGGPALRRGRAPLILRCRPDGRDVEFLSGAQGNPVKAAFTPEGEPLVCGTWSGSNGDRQDVIIHCVEGGDYPVLDGDFGEHKRTGGLLPPLTKLGVAAAAGVMRYRGEAFPAAYRGNLFSALFNMHKVVRHVVERDGATFRARDEDFLVSDDEDFHPTDVLEDADGSILVVDTGSWFSHCPTSKVGKSPVVGAIYRVRRQGVAPSADPRGLALAWDRLLTGELAGLLDDRRFVVRDRAVEPVGEERCGRGRCAQGRCSTAAPVRVPASTPSGRWRGSKTRSARAAIRPALNDADMAVRLTAATAVALLRDPEALPRLMELVRTGDPAVRREAATALGRLGKGEAVPALLDGLRAGGDLFLEHSLIFALIRLADRRATLAGLGDPSPLVRRGALIALDQMDGGGLTMELLAPHLESTDLALQQAALKVVAARPEWASAMFGLLRRWLGQANLDETRRGNLREALVAFSGDATVRELIASTLRRDETPVATRLLLLEAITRATGDRLPPAWVAELRRGLDHPDGRVVRASVAILRAAGVADFDGVLLRLARDEAREAELRVDALAAVVPRLNSLDPPLFEVLAACLRQERPPLLRLAAAGALGQSPLDDAQLEALARTVADTGALELSRLLPAYERSSRAAVGAKLVAALGRSPGLTSLTPEALRQLLRSYPAEVRDQAAPLLARLEIGLGEQLARLAGLETLLGRGDTSRGREIFLGQKAACTTCHSVGARGAARGAGPQQDRRHPHGARPAGVHRLSQRHLRPRVRALHDRDGGWADPYGDHRPGDHRELGRGLARSGRAPTPSPHDRGHRAEPRLDHAPGPGRPAHPPGAGRPHRFPSVPQIGPLAGGQEKPGPSDGEVRVAVASLPVLAFPPTIQVGAHIGRFEAAEFTTSYGPPACYPSVRGRLHPSLHLPGFARIGVEYHYPHYGCGRKSFECKALRRYEPIDKRSSYAGSSMSQSP